MSEFYRAVLCAMLGMALHCGSGILADEVAARHAPVHRPITRPAYAPSAQAIPLFDGLEAGQLKARVIAKNSMSGHVLVTNLSPEPLTVILPQTFVAVHVLKQFQPANAGLGNGANIGLGQQNGQQQSIGGGMQAPGAANNANAMFNLNAAGVPGGVPPGMGNGFFSIPPEKTVKVSFRSVCLEYGKPDPTTTARYKLVRTETYTHSAQLRLLLSGVADGNQSLRSLQAAVWHVANGVSWQDLKAMQTIHVGRKAPWFSRRELANAAYHVRSVTGASDPKSASATTVAGTR